MKYKKLNQPVIDSSSSNNVIASISAAICNDGWLTKNI